MVSAWKTTTKFLDYDDHKRRNLLFQKLSINLTTWKNFWIWIPQPHPFRLPWVNNLRLKAFYVLIFVEGMFWGSLFLAFNRICCFETHHTAEGLEFAQQWCILISWNGIPNYQGQLCPRLWSSTVPGRNSYNVCECSRLSERDIWRVVCRSIS